MAGVWFGLLIAAVGGCILLYVIIRMTVRDGQKDVIRSNKVAQTEEDKKKGSMVPYVVAIIVCILVGAICIGAGMDQVEKQAKYDQEVEELSKSMLRSYGL